MTGKATPDGGPAVPRVHASDRDDELRLSLALEAAGMGVFEWDIASDLITWSRPHEELWGFDPGEFGRTFASFASRLHPDDLPGIAVELERCIATREPFLRQFRVLLPDGTLRWITSRGRFLFGDDGKPQRMLGVVTDSTAAKQQEEELRVAAARLQTILDVSPVPLALNDAQQNITYLNPSFVASFGYSLEDIPTLAAWWPRAYPEEDYRAGVSAEWNARFAKSKRDGTPLQPLEVTIRAKDGTDRTALVGAAALEGAFSGTHMIILHDITERKRAEELRLELERRVQHAQKLESLGVLAGGIAHDFNNLLTAIIGNADLALLTLEDPARARDCLRAIQTAAQRAAEIAQQMLAYSGRGKFVEGPIALSEIVAEMSQLLDVTISKKVALQRALAPDLPRFIGDATQVRQIIMNLITNASDAIGDQPGIVSIVTGTLLCDRTLLDRAVRHSSEAPPLVGGRYVFLEVSDTGCGMTAETIEKMFDPFFTTKFAGRGLGLSAVLGIVRGHAAALVIESELGVGTKITVMFPAAESVTGYAAPAAPAEPKARVVGSGTILLADDEAPVRMVIKQLLEHMGFHVLVAADGREALALFESGAELACVILDLTMPHISGAEAFCEMRRRRPEVKIILTSGYSEHEVSKRFTGLRLSGFVQKPFSMAEFERVVESVIAPAT